MKKTVLFLLSAVLLLTVMTVGASAAENTAYVTISDGTLTLLMKPVTLSDADGDGVISINDALILAHNEYYDGGAEAGYSSDETEYGISMTKLWGVENGGSYGYMLNDAAPMSLKDEIKAGDRICAYVFTDTDTFSDTYFFFDQTSVEAEAGETVTLTVKTTGYDENWAPVTLPLAGASVLIDGKDVGITTDEDGKAEFVIPDAGEHSVTVSSEKLTLIPNACTVTVTASEVTTAAPEESPQTGDAMISCTFLVLSAAFILPMIKKHEVK